MKNKKVTNLLKNKKVIIAICAVVLLTSVGVAAAVYRNNSLKDSVADNSGEKRSIGRSGRSTAAD